MRESSSPLADQSRFVQQSRLFCLQAVFAIRGSAFYWRISLHHADHHSSAPHLAETSILGHGCLPLHQWSAHPLPGSHILSNASQRRFRSNNTCWSHVGRPDLDASIDEAHLRAQALYHSLHKLLTLPAETVVLPGHTSTPVSFDSVPLMTTP